MVFSHRNAVNDGRISHLHFYSDTVIESGRLVTSHFSGVSVNNHYILISACMFNVTFRFFLSRSLVWIFLPSKSCKKVQRAALKRSDLTGAAQRARSSKSPLQVLQETNDLTPERLSFFSKNKKDEHRTFMQQKLSLQTRFYFLPLEASVTSSICYLAAAASIKPAAWTHAHTHTHSYNQCNPTQQHSPKTSHLLVLMSVEEAALIKIAPDVEVHLTRCALSVTSSLQKPVCGTSPRL